MLPEHSRSKKSENFFTDIPQEILLKELDLPKGISEIETKNKLKSILKKNIPFETLPSFIGGSLKPHYIPAVVKSLINRSEFFTSYTPYQPEFSQGILQVLFEYQSMMAELTGMDTINISTYDSATALGEAALMSHRITKKNQFLIPANISWEKKTVLHNYVDNLGIEIKEMKYLDDGLVDISFSNTREISGVYIENPNFFGIFDDRLDQIRETTEDTLLIVGSDPLSLALMKPPREYGADIVIGEGQGLGNNLNFGGSLLGVFGCKKKHVRMMPGKIIGATRDLNGKRAFCMTLQTREQHIRREKATSNICSNEALCAVAATIFLSSLGGQGLQKLAITNMERAKYLANQLARNGFSFPFKKQFFNDFVAASPMDPQELNNALLKRKFHGGLILQDWFPDIGKSFLFGVTEMHSVELIEKFVKEINKIMQA
jgi:glycine dehydrogenase subunit 1